MLRTIIRLSDGTEISSGPDQVNAIRSVKLTQCVNSAKELTLGSACTNMAEIDLQTPNGGLQITAGDEITLFRVDDAGNRRQAGIFEAQKPTRSTANTMRITAYDRVSRLDKDLTDWLADLKGWPYPLLDFANMVCLACGLTLKNDSIPNADYPVQMFTARNITGRRLMQWVGEAAGRFCRATAQGEIEFAWYTPSGVTLTPDGDRFFYQSGLSFENYQVAPIEKVQIKQSKDDVGVVWPDATGEKNTYVISGNYLLTTVSTEQLVPVAQTLYEHLKNVTYTPCKVQIPAGMDIQAGHSVEIIDKNGKSFTTYVMTKIQSGQRDTLECTGSHRRDSTTAVNTERYSAVSRQMLEIKKEVEGLAVTASRLDTQIRQTGEEIEGYQNDVHSLQTSVGELYVNADSVKVSVSDLEQIVNSATEEMQETKEQIASVLLQSDQLEVKIEKIANDGIGRVSNTTGTFNEEGLQIDSTDSATKTLITPDGMTVLKKTYGNEQTDVLTATSEGVDATNLHAKTYLIIGGRSRFENYESDRTGCFWIGG